MELLEEVLRKDSIEQVRQTKEDLDKKHAHELEKVKGQHDEDMEVRHGNTGSGRGGRK